MDLIKYLRIIVTIAVRRVRGVGYSPYRLKFGSRETKVFKDGTDMVESLRWSTILK